MLYLLANDFRILSTDAAGRESFGEVLYGFVFGEDLYVFFVLRFFRKNSAIALYFVDFHVPNQSLVLLFSSLRFAADPS